MDFEPKDRTWLQLVSPVGNLKTCGLVAEQQQPRELCRTTCACWRRLGMYLVSVAGVLVTFAAWTVVRPNWEFVRRRVVLTMSFLYCSTSRPRTSLR